MSATDLAPTPYGKIAYSNMKKVDDQKEGHQKFWEIDDIFGGNAKKISETPKKRWLKIFIEKFGPPFQKLWIR